MGQRSNRRGKRERRKQWKERGTEGERRGLKRERGSMGKRARKERRRGRISGKEGGNRARCLPLRLTRSLRVVDMPLGL